MEKILNSINNYFYKFYESGSYSINTNTITVKGKYIIGQYVRIEGSTLNDGVYKVAFVDGQNITLESLTMQDEEFEGIISSLAIPSDLISLKAKIETYESENKPSAIVSESFGNYSYSLATNANGQALTWQEVFSNELKPYRKPKLLWDKRGVKEIC